MKLSDYVISFLADELGIEHVFGIVGGANTHIADSLVKHSKAKFICTQHEQGASMAAEAYARASNNIGAVLVTSGPGATNAITGLCCAWTDSIPCIFISGQLPLAMTSDGKTVRQLGVQQLNVIDGVKPYTKYAVMITDPNEIRYHLEKAAYLAKSGRPGPVWIDIPTNLQHAIIDLDKIPRFKDKKTPLKKINTQTIDKITKLIGQSKRPVIIGGNGIRLGDMKKGASKFLVLINKLKFPFILTWSGIDLVSHDHPLFIGSAGVMGQRAANYAVANADLIISIGSRLDTRQLGNRPDLYAREAKKIVVDIDHYELEKGLIKIDVPVATSADLFMNTILKNIKPNKIPNTKAWVKKCVEWKTKYPIVLPEYHKNKNRVNSYIFNELLSQSLKTDDIIVTDMGTSLTCTMQTFKVKNNQRLFTNIGLAPMGYGLPGAIGAWFATGGKKRIIGIFGDGGFQMNIQELQTVIHYKIPMKIFVLNNESYLTLKHTQEVFFDSFYAGSDPGSGYSAPDFTKIGKAYNMDTYKLNNQNETKKTIDNILSSKNVKKPVLCEVMMPVDQPLIPLSILDKSRGYKGMPIERQYPFLSDEEHHSNMIVKPE